MTLKFLIRSFVAIAVGATLSGTALAQQSGQSMASEDRSSRVHKSFRLIDTNGDGKITMEEIKAEQQRLLTAADIDGDGKLSAAEFGRRGRMLLSLRVTSLFDLLDTDGDRMVTPAELAAPSERWLGRYDVNNDGLTAEEWPRRKGKRNKKRGGGDKRR